jgi:hypothetical protein
MARRVHSGASLIENPDRNSLFLRRTDLPLLSHPAFSDQHGLWMARQICRPGVTEAGSISSIGYKPASAG